MLQTTKQIIDAAKEKGIKTTTEKVTVSYGKGKDAKKEEIEITLPADRSAAIDLYKAYRSKKSLEGLALSKLKTDQMDEQRRGKTPLKAVGNALKDESISAKNKAAALEQLGLNPKDYGF